MRKKNPILSNMASQELTEIPQRITYLRQDILQITQAQFADAINISQTYLSLLENGSRTITEPIIDQIFSQFKINPDWLYQGKGEIFQSGADFDKEKLIISQQKSAIDKLQTAYSLKESELNFISWYLSLTPKERGNFSKSLNLIKTLF
ncbi:XRE family transcriptional regulator [bacterium D16-51]|nr:XRE family transcriptional regulator [bacterium D16-59]RKI54417.1 XRE family transcriptional regulator [bacterium D16-51]